MSVTHEATAREEANFLARARALVPVLARREPSATQARDVPGETIVDLHQAGLLRLLQPRRFGGHQASLRVFLETIEILAEGCASTGWVYGVLGELEWVIACLPERGQIDIWGDDPEALAAGSIVPRATGVPADGGWRVTGRYAFASGCRHAKWVILGVRCQDGTGREEPRYLFVPTRDVEIIDDWHVLGMRGTGSFTLELRDVFVPNHRSVTIADIVAGTPPGRHVHPDYSVLRAPRYYVVPFVLPSVGFALGRRALALMTAALPTRMLSSSDAFQMRLGRAAALIEAAHVIFTARRTETVAKLESGAPIEPEDVLRNRRDVALAFQMTRQGVEQLVALNGARSVYNAEALQSVLRDVVSIGTHIIVDEEAAMVPYGRFLMRSR